MNTEERDEQRRMAKAAEAQPDDKNLIKHLREIADAPAPNGWYQVGQLIQIDRNVFRVKAVKPDELRLKVVRRTK